MRAVRHGWLGQHVSLQATMAFAGLTGLLLMAVAWRVPTIWGLKTLPKSDPPEASA